MANISAVIITYNVASHIGRCIQSLQGVADEILVADSYSTDATADIARSLGAKVISLDWEGFSKTKNKAQQLAAHDYILSMDADEELSEALKASIVKEKANLKGAYRFNRLNNYYGSWLRYGGAYPDRKIRLFPRQHARWEGEVHEKLVLKPNETVIALKGDLLHYTSQSREEHLARIEKYAYLAAQQAYAQGKRYRAINMWLAPVVRFVKIYVVKGGFLDGKAGWHYARLSAYSLYLRQVKLKQLQAV
ncbi:MAG: glycosyltransferase family 2 protein [Chitinophagales bacterium]|nr:glycosyltransferase family 2 protein [Chitinophagales bacterium]